jgi:SAM-dependent methyltransferase
MNVIPSLFDKEVWSYRDGSGSLHKPRKQKLFANLAEGKTMDIGFAELPNPFLKDVIGVDVQKVWCPKNYNKVYKVNLNKENLPFEDCSFDTVISGEIIEHVENPSHLLREINRVLKIKGKLIISTPHACFYWEIIRNLFFGFKESRDVGEHLSNWNILDFERLLRKNGFEVKRKYGSVLIIPTPFQRIYIPVRNFPRLSWIVIYECIKIGLADNRIYTRGKLNRNYGKITSEVIKIEQC